MIDVLLTWVGGQGTVLASKILAQAAQSKGWKVRTAETIGMAQRGGSVISYVRIGSEGERVHAPLVMRGSADLVIAFEPGEAARVLPYLAPNGLLVTASTPLQPVTASLSREPYRAADVLAGIEKAFAEGSGDRSLSVVDDARLIDLIGGNRKALNTVLLTAALVEGRVPLSLDDLKAAVGECVKPRFVDMNLSAIDVVSGALS